MERKQDRQMDKETDGQIERQTDGRIGGQFMISSPGFDQGTLKRDTVPLTSCLTGLELAVRQLTIFVLFANPTNQNQSNRRSMVQ
jgi:hypothetical protein